MSLRNLRIKLATNARIVKCEEVREKGKEGRRRGKGKKRIRTFWTHIHANARLLTHDCMKGHARIYTVMVR